MPEDIRIDNMESIPKFSRNNKRFSHTSPVSSPIVATKLNAKKNMSNKFAFKSQERDNFLPKVESTNNSMQKKITGRKLPILHTARANHEHLAFETISERTDKIKRTIKRKNSKFSRTGDEEYDKKNYYKSHHGDSKYNDDITSSYHKKGHGSKQSNLNKQPTRQINVRI